MNLKQIKLELQLNEIFAQRGTKEKVLTGTLCFMLEFIVSSHNEAKNTKRLINFGSFSAQPTHKNLKQYSLFNCFVKIMREQPSFKLPRNFG